MIEHFPPTNRPKRCSVDQIIFFSIPLRLLLSPKGGGSISPLCGMCIRRTFPKFSLRVR